MDDLQQFFNGFLNELKQIELSLVRILKEEKRYEHEFIKEKGFIFKDYSLNFEKINLDEVNDIHQRFERFTAIEKTLKNTLKEKWDQIENVKKDYEEFNHKNLPIEKLGIYLDHTLKDSVEMLKGLDELKKLLDEGVKLHKKSLGKDAENLFIKIEKLTVKIIGFVHYLEQVMGEIDKFEKHAYYPEPKLYARVMPVKEYEIMQKSKKIALENAEAYDIPGPEIGKIKYLTDIQLRKYFSTLGVDDGKVVVIFATREKPINHHLVGSSKGWTKFIFHKDTNIEFRKAA